jgi:hypothetical protein
MKRVVLFLIIFNSIVLSQQINIRQLRTAAIDREPDATALQTYTSKRVSPLQTNSPANWVLVDSMTNIYGYYSEEIHPLYYSPRANKTTLVHRGDATSYASTSGEIYDNLSSDGGITWTRCDTPFNPFGVGRYPSGSIYYNSAINDYYQFAVWPELFDSITFGDLDAGIDFPLGTCNPYSFIDLPVELNKYYGVGSPTWSSEQRAFWATTINDGIRQIGTEIWRTTDFSDVSGTVPPSLDTTRVVNNLNQFSGDAINVGTTTVTAYAFAGTSYVQYHPDIDSAILSSHTIHIIYSTNNGTTWSNPDSVSFSTLSGIGSYRTLWSWDGNLSHTPGHMVLDSLGYPHIVCGLQQEPVGEAGNNVIIAEIYKQGTGFPADAGTWKGKIITSANPSTIYLNGAVGFMPNITRNEEGTFFAAQWIDGKQSNNMADLFCSGRYWRAQNWNALENITSTPDIPEYLAHLSPRMRRDGDSLFTVFSTFALPNDLGDPFVSPNRTRMWVGTYQLDLTPIKNDVIPVPPNGFNTILIGDSICWQPYFINNGEQECDSFYLKSQIIYKGMIVFEDSVLRVCPPDSNMLQSFCFTPFDTGLHLLRLLISPGDQISGNDTVTSYFNVITPPSIMYTTMTRFHSAYQELSDATEIDYEVPLGGYASYDDGHQILALPYPFVYDGVEYDSVQFSTNGWVEFGKKGYGRDSLPYGLSLPNSIDWNNNGVLFQRTPLFKVMSAFHEDMNVNKGGDQRAGVFYKVEGESPNRVFTIEWRSMLAYYDTVTTTARVNFQTRLFERTNYIEFHYGPVVTGTWAGEEVGAQIALKDIIGGDYHFFDAVVGKSTREKYATTLYNENIELIWPGPDSVWKFQLQTLANTVAFEERWNLVSVSLERDDYSVISIFPNAVSGALYRFDGEYHNETSLSPGNGYWLKFPSDTIQMISGTAITSTAMNVNVGWNLIGSISYPVPVATITSIPIPIITSQFYQYVNGYATADTIFPGEGYWVKVNQSGQLILSSEMSNAENRIRIVPITELPPPPPADVQEEKKLPKEFALLQNYPNPFNPTTRFTVELPKDADVQLIVYNLLGQKITTLLNETKPAGYHTITWNGSNDDGASVPSGIYFVKMVSEKFSSVKKLMLIK